MHKCLKLLGIGWWLVILPFVVLGQKNDTLLPYQVILECNSPAINLSKLQKEMAEVGDTASAISLVEEWCLSQTVKGYLECTISHKSAQGNALAITLHLGPRYLLEALSLNGLEPHIIKQLGVFHSQKQPTPVNWHAIESYLDKFLVHYENNGYPFARFSNLSVQYKKTSPQLIKTAVAYTFDYGPFITIDSIHIEGNQREEDDFVCSLIRLETGMAFNQQIIDDIPRRLNNSIYYEQVKAPTVSFSVDGKASISVVVNQKKAGKFDLLLGLLPPDQPGTNQRLRVTGLVDLVFVSPFRSGEILELTYNRLNALSQFFDFGYTQPNILGTLLGLEGRFKLENRDSSFINRQFNLGASYPLGSYLDAHVFLRNKQTDLLDARPYANDTLIPPILSGSAIAYGIGLSYRKLDYRLNPSKGFNFSLNVGLGKRTVIEDSRLRPEVFEQVPQNQPSSELSLRLAVYLPTFKRQVIRLANRSYWLGQEQYFRNDQPQLGGGKSIRGFNENQFFVDRYTFFSFEYRLLLDRNSHIFVFTDYGLLKNTVALETYSPLGIGFGLTFDTKSAGILSLIYGVGTVGELPLQPSRGKLHIGLINRF